MNRAAMNLMIDALAAFFLVAMIATGYVLWFALPPGTNRTHELWGMLRHTWGTLHASASLGLMVLVVLHLALHWKWLVTNLSKRVGLGAWQQEHPRAASVGVASVVILPLGVFATLSVLRVRVLPTPIHDDPLASQAITPDEWHDDPVESLRVVSGRILTFRCATCHGQERRAGGVRADTPQALLMEQNGVRWVVPGDVDRSRLFSVLVSASRHAASKGAHVIPEEELQSLQTWVAKEAPR